MWNYVKTILQVVALTAVLATWSTIDRVFEAVAVRKNSLHVWFGPPRTPSVIHIGEIYNATIEWEANLASRKTYINITMELGLRCSNRRDGHISYVIENWIVQKKTGTLYVDYPMTHKDLNRAYDEGLCFLHLDYKYWPNTGNTTVVIDEAMSSVFKLSRKPRLIPLPLANATDLTPKERVLTLQLRNMSPEELHGESEEATEDEMVEDTEKAVGKEEKGPAVVGKAAAGNRAVTLRKPFVKEYAYTGVSLWPEDDPDWSIDEVVSPWTVMFWVGAVVGVMVLREHWLVRRTTDRVTQAVYQWWTADIEDPLVPRKGARRRSIFRSNVPDHTA